MQRSTTATWGMGRSGSWCQSQLQSCSLSWWQSTSSPAHTVYAEAMMSMGAFHTGTIVDEASVYMYMYFHFLLFIFIPFDDRVSMQELFTLINQRASWAKRSVHCTRDESIVQSTSTLYTRWLQCAHAMSTLYNRWVHMYIVHATSTLYARWVHVHSTLYTW